VYGAYNPYQQQYMQPTQQPVHGFVYVTGMDGAKRSRLDVSGQDRRQLLKTSLEEWAAWESDAAKAYSEASVALSDDAALYRLVRKLQRGAERELAEARDYISELSACNWDIVHAFDMGGER